MLLVSLLLSVVGCCLMRDGCLMLLVVFFVFVARCSLRVVSCLMRVCLLFVDSFCMVVVCWLLRILLFVVVDEVLFVVV